MARSSSQGLTGLHPGAAPPSLAPLALILEFARASQGGDPYAFRVGRQDYLLRGAGGSFESAELHWNEALLADLEAIRRPNRDPLAVQRLGDTLRRFLQPTGWHEHESHILAALQERRRVVLTLRSAAAELYSLPWELVTLKSTGQHLAELPGLLVHYEWPDTHTAPAAAPTPPGRILLGWSAAAGAVPANEHIAAIRAACLLGSHPFDPERDVLAHVSLRRLAETLDVAQTVGPPIVVLHLLCHGGAVGATFGLTLDGDEDGSRVVVDAGRLRQLLAPYAAMVRLVVLAACDSGDSGAIGNQLGSLAQALHRAGLAKVVASRFPLSAVGSIRLAEVLYHELLAGPGSLEEALLSARKQVARNAAHLDWASLQLYARAQDPSFQWVDYLRGPQVPLAAPALLATLAELAELTRHMPVPPALAEGIRRLQARTLAGPAAGPAAHREARIWMEQLDALLVLRSAELLGQPRRPGESPWTPPRSYSELRQEVERGRGLADQALAAVVTEWQERLHRQVDYVLEEAGKWLSGLQVTDHLERGHVIVQVTPGWQQEFTTFVNQVLAGWVRSDTGHVAVALHKALQPALQVLAAVAPLPAELVPAATPRPELFRLAVAPTRHPVPGVVSTLWHLARKDVRWVVLCVLGVAAVLGLPSVLGKALPPGSAWPSSGNLTLLLPAATILLLALAGYAAVLRNRHDQRQKLLRDRRKEISAALHAELQQLAERQRATLEALLVKQLAQGTQRNLESWFVAHAKPALQRAAAPPAPALSDRARSPETAGEELARLHNARDQLTKLRAKPVPGG